MPLARQPLWKVHFSQFPCSNTVMGTARARHITLYLVLTLLFLAEIPSLAQNAETSRSSSSSPLPSTSSAAPVVAPSVPDYSGMYAFRRDGEFLQLNVENDGRLTGFVSRYGDLDSDKGEFMNQFFKQAKLEGKNVSFVTTVVHGKSFEFKGSIERGEGKNPNDEAYYVLKGTLTEVFTGDGGKTSSKNEEVAFKSFPRDLNPSQ